MFQWKINLLQKIFPKDFLLVLSEISSTVGFPLEKGNTRIKVLHSPLVQRYAILERIFDKGA